MSGDAPEAAAAAEDGADTLAIAAGAGPLPRRLIAACRNRGVSVLVIAFDGQTDPETPAGVPHLWTRLGAAGSVVDRLARRGVRRIVLAGGFRRPGLAELRPDWATARLLPRLGLGSLGDDAVMRRIEAILSEKGIRVIGVQDVLGEDLAAPGRLTRAEPDALALDDLARARAVARAIGRLDAGQGAVVQQGVVLAVEAAEGTDAMLARCAGLRREGPGGVLVKAKKPQQDDRLDLPTIGTATVEAAAAAGLRGIAVEAGGALIVDRSAVGAAADRLGLFVLVLEPDPDPQPERERGDGPASAAGPPLGEGAAG